MRKVFWDESLPHESSDEELLRETLLPVCKEARTPLEQWSFPEDFNSEEIFCQLLLNLHLDNTA